MDDVMTYGTVSLIFNTALQAQYTFQSYLIVAEKPKLAMWVVVAAGVANMVLDYLFMAVFGMGIGGAALATGLSQCVAGLLPLLWFLSKRNTSALRFARTRLEWRPMLRSCGNGASEMLSSVSAAVTGILYNLQLIRYAGEDGVAAYGVVMYAAFVFLGVFMGYSMGSSPILGYHYGAENVEEMRSLLRKSLILLGTAGVVLTTVAVAFARPLSAFFVGYDKGLLDMTTRAFAICAVPFLFMWFNMYTSSVFTALNDGLVSAIISFVRSLLLPVVCIIFMPMVWKLDGVWYSLVASEVLALAVSLTLLLRGRKKYRYF
jgi:Na+-driven multidrug efflux pump